MNNCETLWSIFIIFNTQHQEKNDVNDCSLFHFTL